MLSVSTPLKTVVITHRGKCFESNARPLSFVLFFNLSIRKV